MVGTFMKPEEPNRSNGRPRVLPETRPAFTLLELLVVIGIIGILAALIMTAVSQAKNSASKTTDINNLNQFITALHVYTSDDGGVLPPPNWDNGGFAGPQGTNIGWLYAVDLSATGTNRFRVNTGLFWPILQDPKLYFCPMDNPAEARMSAYDGVVEQRPQQISSYAMNGAVIGYNSMIYPAVNLDQLQPGDCAFWETDETEPHYFNDGANYPGEGVSPRHHQGGIQATFGGQVDYVRLPDWYNDVAYTNKNRLWCYPNSVDGGDPARPGHQQE